VIADVEGVRAGVGLIVCQRGWAGVFCMVTDPLMRRRGVACSILHAAAQVALRGDCYRLYLQVEHDNLPAQALYARAGFVRSHGYHYRLAPQTLAQPGEAKVLAPPCLRPVIVKGRSMRDICRCARIDLKQSSQSVIHE
jgi:hypothetical protein